MTDNITAILSKPLITVPDLAKILNVSRNGAYEVVRRGDVESIKIGPKVIRIPTAPLKRKLGIAE